MKYSSRRNCDASRIRRPRSSPSLNEVQFPKELRPWPAKQRPDPAWSLNEVQFPKELRHAPVDGGSQVEHRPQ